MKHNILDSKSSANYKGFSLVSGGLIYYLTSVFRRKGDPKWDLPKTAIALAVITWLPLGLLAIYYGTFNDDDTTISFFEDFVVHVRFLFVLPFLIIIEKMVNKNFIEYIKNTDNIIPDAQQLKYNRLVKLLRKLTGSFIPEIVVLVIYYIAIITNPQILSLEESGRNYLTYSGTNTLNIAGWYNFLFCIPIYILVIFRWFWRWIVWFYSMIRISYFKIYLDPLHADKMAGLGYLNLVPLTFSFILIAPSAMLSSEIGIDIIYNNATFMSYYQPILIYVFLAPIILYSPLFAFMPKLTAARGEGILKFGDLVRKHNYDYVKKWIDGKKDKDDHILGTMDNSSLADINGSYAPIDGTKLVPMDLSMIIRSFIMNIIPYIPLVFTYYSFAELFKLFMKSMAGG